MGAGRPVVASRDQETIPPHRTPVTGLYLANTTQIYPEDRGQNYSIRMGRRVARLAIAGHRDTAEAAERDTAEGAGEPAGAL